MVSCLEDILEDYSACLWWQNNKRKSNQGVNGRDLNINLDAIRSTPDGHHPTSVVAQDVTGTPALVRDGLTPAREAKLKSPPPSRGREDAPGRKKAMALSTTLFSLIGGS